MNWILEHIQLLFIVGGAIAWWLNHRRQAREENEAGPRSDAAPADADMAERTRRIREEIQRKIEERSRGAGRQPSPPPLPMPPVLHGEIRETRSEPPRLQRPPSPIEAQRTAEILEQQAALNEKLRQAQEMKAVALRRAQYERRVSSGEQVPAGVRVAALTQELRNPEALRRAFILREIIGPPVALR